MATITFAVEAYDQEHLAALNAGPRSVEIAKLINGGLVVSDTEILIHAMFTEQDPNRIGYDKYYKLAQLFERREDTFRDYFSLSNNDIFATGSQNSTQKGQTERLGVACSILAMNKILGVTEADWERIEESNKSKTLDYQLSVSNGISIVGVESKGTIADNPAKKSSGSTSDMKGSIEAKKKAARLKSKLKFNEEYGVITAIGNKSGIMPRIYLLDPPSEGTDMDPGKIRILNRLRYYKHQLSYVSGFGLLAALENRINIFDKIDDYKNLDGISLAASSGEPIMLPGKYYGRPLIEVNGIIGRCYGERFFRRRTPDWKVPFFGFDRKIFDILAAQKFNNIVEYKSINTDEYSKKITFWANAGEKKSSPFTGNLRYRLNSAGIAYGWVKIE